GATHSPARPQPFPLGLLSLLVGPRGSVPGRHCGGPLRLAAPGCAAVPGASVVALRDSEGRTCRPRRGQRRRRDARADRQGRRSPGRGLPARPPATRRAHAVMPTTPDWGTPPWRVDVDIAPSTPPARGDVAVVGGGF